MTQQFEITLPPFPRGFHLITNIILKEIRQMPDNGILHIFIKHTSAGLTINENASKEVLIDFENWFNRAVKENESYYQHIIEGSDDMPAHIKTSLVGNSISIPITKGKLNIGIWQGIYLCEFRNIGGCRNLVVTIIE